MENKLTITPQERELLARLFSLARKIPIEGEVFGGAFGRDYVTQDWLMVPLDALEELRLNLYSGFFPKKIISGGQQGADLAALYAAASLGIPTGGTAPRGWRIQLPDGSDGSNPGLASFGLREHRSPNYPPRTIQNVADADATLWVGHEDSPGGRLTINTATAKRKRYIVNPTAAELRAWVYEHQISTLNVAGNRTSDFNPGIYEQTYDLLIEAFG